MRPDISYPEALALQDLVWNVAWAGLTEDICGVEVMPLTPWHFVRLAAARSPFVCGGRDPSRQDVDNFLWAISPLYDPKSRWKKFRHWLRYFKATKNLTLAELIAGIDEFMDEAWMDSPPRPDTRMKSKAFYAPVVSMIRVLCPEYNLTPEMVMHTPYKQLFQLYKPISESLGGPIVSAAELVLMRQKARARNQN